MKAGVLAIACVMAPALAGECRSHPTEEFSGFFARFAVQKQFSVSRSLYPSYVIRHDAEAEIEQSGEHTIRTPLSREDDAATPTIDEQVQRNGMQTKIRLLSARQAVIELFKPDTDWLLTYHFENRRGCWYLHHVEDHSL